MNRRIIYIPVIGWIISYVKWIQSCRMCDRSGAIPFSKEWNNVFNAYDKTVVSFRITVAFLVICIMACIAAKMIFE